MASKLGLAAPTVTTAANIDRGPRFALSTAPQEAVLALSAGQLPEALQTIARNYVGARRRSGEAMLDAARWLTDARAIARHGEWQTFLDATGTSESTAKRYLDLHTRAMENPLFAEAVRTDWFSFAIAAMLAQPSTPPELIDAALNAPEPPTRAMIEQEKRALKSATVADLSPTRRTPVQGFANGQANAERLGAALSFVDGRYELNVDGVATTSTDYADIQAQLVSLKQAQQLGPGQSAPTPLPPAPEAWHWERGGAGQRLVHADSGHTTAWCEKPAKALAQAQQIIDAAWKPSAPSGQEAAAHAILDRAEAWEIGAPEHRRLLAEAEVAAQDISDQKVQQGVLARIADVRGAEPAALPAPRPDAAKYYGSVDRAVRVTTAELEQAAKSAQRWLRDREALDEVDAPTRAAFKAAIKAATGELLSLATALNAW